MTPQDKIAGAEWLSILNLKRGFWQVALDQDDKDKTAISNGKGLQKFTVKPSGPAMLRKISNA
jgi:hypothetical protein